MDALCPRLVCLCCNSSPSEWYTSVWVADKEKQTGSFLCLKIIDKMWLLHHNYLCGSSVWFMSSTRLIYFSLHYVSFKQHFIYYVYFLWGHYRKAESLWTCNVVKKQFPSCRPGSHSAPWTASPESLLWPFRLPINLLSDCSGQLTLCELVPVERAVTSVTARNRSRGFTLSSAIITLWTWYNEKWVAVPKL